jgi:inactivated superfamily I helicase
MRNETREILGIEVQITGIADTLAEAITAAGSEAAVLNDYNGAVLAHSHYTQVRKTVCAKLNELTGIKRLTKKHGDKEVFDETEAAYVDRVREELGEEGFASHVGAIQAAVAAMPVDYKPGTRGSGGSTAKPAKKWFDYVAALKTNGRFDEFVTKYDLIKAEQSEDDLNLAVALKVKEIVTEQEKAARAAAVAAL